MSELSRRDRDIFDSLVGDIVVPIEYHHEGGYYALSIDDEIQTIRELCATRLQSLRETLGHLKPDQDDINFLTTQLEDVMSRILHDVVEGCHVATTSAAMVVYEEEGSGRFVLEPLDETRSLVGTYHGIVIANMPVWDPHETVSSGGIDFVDTPAFLIERPYIESSSGETEYLKTKLAIVSLSSPQPQYVKRIYSEGVA